MKLEKLSAGHSIGLIVGDTNFSQFKCHVPNWGWLLYGVVWGHASSIIPDSRVENNTVWIHPSQSASTERLFICHRAQYEDNFSPSQHSFRFMKSNNFFSGSHQFPEITIQMRNRHAFNYGDRERISFSPRQYSRWNMAICYNWLIENYEKLTYSKDGG